MIITADKLRKAGACTPAVEALSAAYPEGVQITGALCLAHAHDATLDWDWAAKRLLPAPLYAAYQEQEVPLYAAYLEQLAPLWAAYTEQEAALYATYLEQRAPLLATYHEQRAAIFGRLAEHVED